jgi:phospholipase/carboxylesterase
LSPFTDDPGVRLDGIPVLIIDGEKDSRRSPGDGARLAERLLKAGANVTHRVLPVGHSITAMDEQIAKGWCGSLDQ